MQSASAGTYTYLVPSIALLLGIGEVALPVTGLTAYSEVEGVVRVSLTVSIKIMFK